VDATFARWGCGLGFELNSTGGDVPMKQLYQGAVKCFDISLSGNSGGNPVRIAYTQAADMTDKVAPYVQLDPITTGWDGRVCFEDVNCPAWATAAQCMPGGPYDLQIQVVGGELAGNFNLCLTNLTPSDGTGTGVTTLGQLCGDINSAETTNHRVAGSYIIQNNVFVTGNGNQCITAKAGGGVAGFSIDSSTLSTGGNSPLAYPSVVYGWHYDKMSTGTGLPKAFSAIQSAPSSVSYTTPNGGKYNAAFDLWAFPPTAVNPVTPAGGVEIMIWLAAGGGPQPIGTMIETVTLNDIPFQVWQGTNSTWQVVSFWATNYVPSLNNFDLKPFLDKTVELDEAQQDWNLFSVQFGFEIWNGAGGGAVTSFKQEIN
jgi:hypothetical protein